MLVRLVLGLFALKAVVASPRFSRQVDLDTYNYEVDLDNLNSENQDIYDYNEELTIDDPQIEIGTLAPPDYPYPVPEGSLEEHEEEEKEEVEELPLKPQLIPQGSGGSGVLMGPDTQKEVELHLTPIDIHHVSRDFEGSIGSEASAASGASGSGGSRDLLVSGASGEFGEIVFISGASEELISSGGSGEFLGSGDILISGDLWASGDLSGSGDPSGSGDTLEPTSSGASGDLGSAGSGISFEFPFGSGGSGISSELPIGSEGSGDQSGSGFSGDLLISGASGSSGVSGDSGESGDSGIIFLSGEEELPLIHEPVPHEASGASGEFSGASGISGTSGDTGVTEVTLVPDIDEEEELLLTTPETPQEGTGSVEGSVSSELPEPGMPTCLLCICLGGSVYCDDLKLDSVPPLPKDTTHFYARYNKITKINKSDFASMNKLKRIDLTANEIRTIEDRAFLGLPGLEELVIRENHLSQLPALPNTMTLIDASHNNIGTKGIHKEAFKDMIGLLYLYLTDNHLDYIPVPLPDSLRALHLQRNNIQMMHEDTFCNLKDFNYIRNALEDIRLDGNPINLSRTPQAYVCLPRIPIGALI
uniref:Epiphycan n=1 Tax=Mastacembelus armatus TaxID=205130 RepID=A0A3Q3LXM5_9TELE